MSIGLVVYSKSFFGARKIREEDLGISTAHSGAYPLGVASFDAGDERNVVQNFLLQTKAY
jgi:hypothetical protein